MTASTFLAAADACAKGCGDAKQAMANKKAFLVPKCFLTSVWRLPAFQQTSSVIASLILRKALSTMLQIFAGGRGSQRTGGR